MTQAVQIVGVEGTSRLDALGTALFGKGWKSIPPIPPQVACVYAFEMSDHTVKIGVTHNVQKRIRSVEASVYLKVVNSHFTGFAPFKFMRSVESACHKSFEARRVRGEYFNIAFHEACAELDKHSGEIANALKEADKNFLEELARWEKAQVKQVDKNVLNPGKKVSESICAEALPLGRKSVWRIITDDRRYVVALVNEDGLVITASEFTSEKDAQSACNIVWATLVKCCGEEPPVNSGLTANKPSMSFKDFAEAILAAYAND